MTNNTESAKSYDTAAINKLAKSQIEIVGSIPSIVWEKFRSQALKNVNESVTFDGFRKGQIPENVLIAKVGESILLEEMAELAISKSYVDIIIDNKLDPIGKPSVTITKLAKGNPLEFKAITAVVPEVKLPDCKALADKEVKKSSGEKFDVSDKDVDEAILKIRKSHAMQNPATLKVNSPVPKDKELSPEEKEKLLLESLPEFNDEFVRGLGDFKDVETFKIKVREIVGQDKKDQAREKLRIKIADSIVEATKVELPDVMVESELKRTQAQFEDDLEKMGVKMDDYLKHAKKSLDEIKKEWTPHAEKKVKLQLILNAIATANNIKPDQKEVEAEVEHILEHYKDADRERAAVYAETVLTNEKVFQWLESNK